VTMFGWEFEVDLSDYDSGVMMEPFHIPATVMGTHKGFKNALNKPKNKASGFTKTKLK